MLNTPVDFRALINLLMQFMQLQLLVVASVLQLYQ